MFYVLDEKGNKIEAYDKQGVLALLEQAIADGDLESIASDSAFVDKLKCCVGTGTHHIAFIPQATYNELKANGQLIADAYYFITDDTTADDLNTQLENLTEAVNTLQTSVDTISSKVNGANKLTASNITVNNTVVNLGVFLPENKTIDNIIGFKTNMKYGAINCYFEGLGAYRNARNSVWINNSTISFKTANFGIYVDEETRELQLSFQYLNIYLAETTTSGTTFSSDTISTISSIDIYLS